MSDEDKLIALEPGYYVNAHAIALGTAEKFGENASTERVVTIVFIDCNGDMHPILVHPEGSVFAYLMSDKFRTDLTEVLQETS